MDANELARRLINLEHLVDRMRPFMAGPLNGGQQSVYGMAITPVTEDYTANGDDMLLLCDATDAAITVTLPPIATMWQQRFYFKKTDSGANAITIDGSGDETIDGAATQTISSQYGTLAIVGGDTEWHIAAVTGGNWPKRGYMFHGASLVTNGPALSYTSDSSQYGSFLIRQSNADGNAFTNGCALAAGTYTLYILCRTNSSNGKVDFTVDGAEAGTVDFYSGSATYNVVKTISDISISSNGYHYITGTTNGKNGSSGGYLVEINAMWFAQASDS